MSNALGLINQVRFSIVGEFGHQLSVEEDGDRVNISIDKNPDGELVPGEFIQFSLDQRGLKALIGVLQSKVDNG